MCNRTFWGRGYYVDTVGKNAKKIQEYIQKQLQEDSVNDQISLMEYMGPFTGEPVKKDKKYCFLSGSMKKNICGWQTFDALASAAGIIPL